MRKLILPITVVALSAAAFFTVKESLKSPESAIIPEKFEEEEFDEERMKRKLEDWSQSASNRHQKMLKKYEHVLQGSVYRAPGAQESFGSLTGGWKNRGPRNMPGAFKFAEMLDGTDTIYAVTHNHYSGEFNSKSYIYKGTVYNPVTGAAGDDFVNLTPHWPNRYKNLIVFKYNGNTRMIAGIENGPIYYSDNEGQDWTTAANGPSVAQSTIINRQDGNVYSTDGAKVYVSSDGGASFSTLQDFGGSGYSSLYSPRYDIQPNASEVYFARSGVFYQLNGAKTSFTIKGSYTGSQTSSNAFSIGGDSRKLYVTYNKNYFVSTNSGASWTVKNPKGNWYGDRSGAMSAGMFLAVSPADENHVWGGYAQPVFSTDGLDTDVSTTSGWGSYQNGTSLGISDYHDRIRFNYHPDFQASHFFYNASGNLFTVGCTDGGLFMSYKVWYDHPTSTSYDNSGYANAHFINITTLNLPTALIYRNNLFTGSQDPNHIAYSTQDQGSGDLIPGSTGDVLDFYQIIGGDGPPLNSADGNWVWKWNREGKEVWVPKEFYNGATKKTLGAVKGQIEGGNSVTFTKTATVGWVQTYIDRDEPSKRMWLLGRSLDRATVSGTSITGSTISKGGSNQITAITQATLSPNKLWFLQEGKVYASTDRGTSFGSAVSTPFSKTSNSQNIGGGWVLPTNDNWILFAGPSANGVGAVLSKDGGATWTDVTGDFPSGDDFQVGGMVGTPDGQYVFAGTDVGPFVFDVSDEKWYPMFGGEAGMFNTTAIEYVESIKTVRFGTWGSGVWDFAIDDNSPSLNLQAVASNNQVCDSLVINWSASNITGSAEIKLFKGSTEMEAWTVSDVEEERFAWLIADGYAVGSDYTISIEAGGVTKTSSTFSISSKMKTLAHTHLSIDFVDSEHSASRLASNTIDNDNSTFWHTEWSPSVPAFPHTIIYESDSVANWVGFRCLPRQDGSSNGRVANYKVYGSSDKVAWTELKDGTLLNQSASQTVSFDTEMECKYIKFEMLSEVNGNAYASLATFDLLYAVECGVVTNNTVVDHQSDLKINAVLPGRLLQVETALQGEYDLRVVSMSGKLLWKQNVTLSKGKQEIQLPQKLKSAKLVVISLSNEKNTQHRSLFIRN